MDGRIAVARKQRALKASAFSPAHMTGIFAVRGGSSCGAGVTLDRGVETTAGFLGKGAKKDEILINGKPSSAPVSKYVADAYRKFSGPSSFFSISHSSYFPVGFGFGTSASGALSLSLAMNDVVGAGFSYEECVRIAAEADLACGCGVGGVKASSMGGFLFRETPESKKIARLKIPSGVFLVCAPLSPISTKKVLSDRKVMQRINELGMPIIARFGKNPTPENLAKCSNEFALETGIASGQIREILQKNPDFGMAQLGNTVFGIGKDRGGLVKRMGRFSKSVLVAKLSGEGARVI